MSTFTIEMLTPQQVSDEWGALEPLFAAACKSNEVAELDMSPQDIYAMAVAGLCAVFVGREDGRPRLSMAVQFADTNGHKCAEIVAMGGAKLLKFKRLYWNLILDWLRANGCEFLDVYANERMAKVYVGKFGFTRACVFLRMPLQET